MDTQGILKQLQAERARVDAAIKAIEALDGSAPVKSKPAATAPIARTPGKRGGRRRLSAAGRAKIAAAAKARWARVHAIADAGKAKSKK